MADLNIQKFMDDIREHFEIVGKYHTSPYVPKQLTQDDGTKQDGVLILTGDASPLRYGKPMVLMHPDHEEWFLGQMEKLGQRWKRIDWKTEPFQEPWESSFLRAKLPYVPDETLPLKFDWTGFYRHF